MVEYTKVNVRLSDSQLKKLKDAVSNNTGTTLRISLKMFDVVEVITTVLFFTKDILTINHANKTT